MSRPARWLLPDCDSEGAAQLALQLGIHAPAARVLWHRGWREAGQARRFLQPCPSDAHDPFRMKDMDRAVARLRKAIEGKERILLYGDYDVDGVSSVTILKTALDLLGGRADFYIPNRLKEGYGMREEVIEQAAAEKVGLVVSVDTGTRSIDVVRKAAALGVDIIIADHHLPEQQLPPALALLNPLRPGCEYPDKQLCAAGIVFKLVDALLVACRWPEARRTRLLDSLLKLVAIATVADVVPLVGENRLFVRRGLEGLRSVRNLGLKALMEVAGFKEGERPTAGQIGFRIAPRLNAAGRMASAAAVIELFLTADPDRARVIAGQLHSWNLERQQTEMDTMQAIEEQCRRKPVTDADAALVFAGEGWHKGVVGIVASRLVERYHRPVLVLSTDREAGLAQGSGRSTPEFHLVEALEAVAHLLLRYGGHRQAAGISVSLANLEEFRVKFNDYAASRLNPDDFRPRVRVDAVVGIEELTEESVAEVFQLAPFGYGNPSPVFAICGVEVAEAPVVWKEKHLGLRVRRNGCGLFVRGWQLGARAAELQPGQRIDLAFTLEEDSYAASRGYAGWSANLREFRPHGGDMTAFR